MSNTKTTAAANTSLSQPKKLKKGLKVDPEFFVNLEHVCGWIFHEKSIQLQLSDQNIVDIFLESTDETSIITHPTVTINEFKRIEREIKEYMGL